MENLLCYNRRTELQLSSNYPLSFFFLQIKCGRGEIIALSLLYIPQLIFFIDNREGADILKITDYSDFSDFFSFLFLLNPFIYLINIYSVIYLIIYLYHSNACLGIEYLQTNRKRLFYSQTGICFMQLCICKPAHSSFF